jgi:hypothetical protein
LTEGPDTLREWMDLRSVSLADLRARTGAGEDALIHDAAYGPSTGLTGFRDRSFHPGTFFFRDGSLVVLYTEFPTDHAPDLTRDALLEEVQPPDAELRARSGRADRQYVNGEKGLAVAAGPVAATYVEIFPPMTLDEYKERLYIEPGEFVR